MYLCPEDVVMEFMYLLERILETDPRLRVAPGETVKRTFVIHPAAKT